MSGVDREFLEHMRLLALDTDGDHADPAAERRERMREELRMTPLFSPAVKDAAASAAGVIGPGSVSEGTRGGAAAAGAADKNDTFPQYGLLAGALAFYGTPSVDVNASSNDAVKRVGGPSGGAARNPPSPTSTEPSPLEDAATQQLPDAADPRIFLNVNTPWSAFICGSQGSGKSHTLSCMLENCLLGDRNGRGPATSLGRLPRPLAGIVFHYDKFSAANTTAGGPSAGDGDGGGASLGQICEAAWLCSAGLPVRVLVSPSNLRTMQRAYMGMAAQVRSASADGERTGLGAKPAPSLVVKPLLLQERHLSIDRIMRLMAVSDGNGPVPLYISVSVHSFPITSLSRSYFSSLLTLLLPIRRCHGTNQETQN